jgi:hypothetical protein
MLQKNPEALESSTGIAKQTAEQITGRTQEAITNYFTWLQNVTSAFLNTDMNKELISYATETITAPFALVHKLGQAKNLEDVVKIQTEFVRTQTDSFNKHAKQLAEIYTKVVTAPLFFLRSSAGIAESAVLPLP